MEPSEAGLDAVGRAISEALESETDSRAQIAEARSELLKLATYSGLTQGPWAAVGFAMPKIDLRWAAACGVVLASACLTWFLTQPEALTFDIGENGLHGRQTDLIEASSIAPVALRFSEGSVMDLEPLARARVLSSAVDGARVLLERGAADVSILHKPGQPTHWAFEAGPFVVLVTGTRFHVAWHPETQSMVLTMNEGAVQVSAPCLPAPRTVVKGEALELSCASEEAGRPVITPHQTQKQLPGDSAAEALVAASASELGLPPAPDQPATGSGKLGGGSWQQLLAARDWAGAVRAAEREDFAAVCRRANKSELDALANAARLAGRADLAITALSTLRTRFAGSNEAAIAAFTLGRMAFDQRGDYRAAVTWFGSYLSERPRGPLMGDATGRLMEARARSGDKAGARRDARNYLDRFPHGPYARAAGAILAE